MNRTDLTTEKTHSGWALGCTCNHLHPPEIKDAKEMLYELISREKVALQLTNAYVFSLLLLPDTSITETTCFHSCWHFVYEVSLTNIANKTSQNKQHHFGGQGLSYWWTQFRLHDINTFCCTCRRCIHFRLWKSTHGSCTAAWKRGPCRYHRPVKEKKSHGQMLSLSWSPQGWSLSLDWRTS